MYILAIITIFLLSFYVLCRNDLKKLFDSAPPEGQKYRHKYASPQEEEYAQNLADAREKLSTIHKEISDGIPHDEKCLEFIEAVKKVPAPHNDKAFELEKILNDFRMVRDDCLQARLDFYKSAETFWRYVLQGDSDAMTYQLKKLEAEQGKMDPKIDKFGRACQKFNTDFRKVADELAAAGLTDILKAFSDLKEAMNEAQPDDYKDTVTEVTPDNRGKDVLADSIRKIPHIKETSHV